MEINYTVSTFDEMNMCKSRLRVVDKEELERNKQKKTKMDVFTFEVDDTVADLNGQLKDAELKFIRKMGTLKYLRHLEQNKELQNCPICDQRPEHKVGLLGTYVSGTISTYPIYRIIYVNIFGIYLVCRAGMRPSRVHGVLPAYDQAAPPT